MTTTPTATAAGAENRANSGGQRQSSAQHKQIITRQPARQSGSQAGSQANPELHDVRGRGRLKCGQKRSHKVENYKIKSHKRKINTATTTTTRKTMVKDRDWDWGESNSMRMRMRTNIWSKQRSLKEVKAASSFCLRATGTLSRCLSHRIQMQNSCLPKFQTGDARENISNIFDCLCAVSTNQTDEPPCRANSRQASPPFPTHLPLCDLARQLHLNVAATFWYLEPAAWGRGGRRSEAAASGPTLALILCFITFDMRMANSV